MAGEVTGPWARFFGYEVITYPQCIERVETMETAPCQPKTLEVEKETEEKVTTEVNQPRRSRLFNWALGPKKGTQTQIKHKTEIIKIDYLACPIDLKSGERQVLRIFPEDAAMGVFGLAENDIDGYEYRGSENTNDLIFEYIENRHQGPNLWMYEGEKERSSHIREAMVGDFDWDGDRDVILEVETKDGSQYGILTNLRSEPSIPAIVIFGAFFAYASIFPMLPNLQKAAEGTCYWQRNFGWLTESMKSIPSMKIEKEAPLASEGFGASISELEASVSEYIGN